MKHSLTGLLLVALLQTIPAAAQNLVVNPSFENLVSCPVGISELDRAVSWRDPFENLVGDTCSTSDLYNACSGGGGFGVGVPGNILGSEPAHTGVGYAGIILYEGFALTGCESLFGSGWREYVEGMLTTPLIAGQTYCISFHVSLADNVKFAASNFGVYLSPTLVNVNCATIGANSNLPLTPQLEYTGPPIATTNGWERLQWNYTATGGEQYIVIGNFRPDAGTTYLCANAAAFNPYAYYYIDDVSVIEDPCCLADIDPVPPLCVDDAPVTLVAETPGGTWSGPGITNATTGVFNPAAAGIGSHTIFHTLSCGTDSMVIVVGSCATLVVCSNPNGTWTVSNGVGPYSWQNQTTTQDCSACVFGCDFPPGCAINTTAWTTFATGVTVPTPTTFPVQVLDGSGAVLIISSANSVAPCTVCPTISVNIVDQSDVLCPGGNSGTGSVLASGGTGPYTYTWTPGNLSGASQNALNAGTYTVTATDANNCTGTVSVTIGQPANGVVVSIASTTDASCAGNDGQATAQASGGTAPIAFSWAPSGGSVATASGLAPGTYTVTATDANGCTAQTTATIVSLAGPAIVDVTTLPSDCDAANGSITVTATGTGLQYSIDGGLSFQADGQFDDLAPGLYNIVVSDPDGCSSTSQATVSTLTGPVIQQVTSTTPSCGLANGTITVSATGQDLVYSVDGGLTYQASNVFTGLAPGTWNVVVSDGGCTASTTVVLVDGPGPVIDSLVASQPLCNGDANGSVTVSVAGSGPYEYSIDGGVTYSTNPVFSGLPAGDYTIEVRDVGGCTASSSISLVDPEVLQVSVTGTDPSCASNCNGSASATVLGGTPGNGYIYSWPGALPAPNTPQTSGLCGGDFTMQVADANGCTASSSFSLVAPPPFTIQSQEVTAESCSELCDGSIVASAPGAVGYQLGQGPVQSGGTFQGLCPGTYTITASDASGCTASGTSIVAAGLPVEASFTTSPTVASVLDPVFSFTNTSTNAETSVWDFGPYGTSTEQNPNLTLPSEPGDYQVCLTVTNVAGCSDIACAILVVRQDFAIYVPNTFTPDADGINDVFHAIGAPSLNENFRMYIFNRWGEQIFSSKDITQGWDGTYLGQKVKQEVYVWQVEVGDPNTTEVYSLIGHVTLLR